MRGYSFLYEVRGANLIGKNALLGSVLYGMVIIMRVFVRIDAPPRFELLN